MNNRKIQCSVGILTFNNAATLKLALESVKNFAEIIVCDGGSTDDTLSLARAFGAKVIVQAPQFKGEDNRVIDFSGVRNQLIESASYPWFFSLDSDEIMTSGLEEEINSIIVSGHLASAFWVPRKYMLDGEIVDCAATYPTKQMRFFHRDAVSGFIKTIHERVKVRPGIAILSLRNYMNVPINPDSSFHRRKWAHYIDLELIRCGHVSFWRWLYMCFENGKISILYLWRYFRNLFFCRGKKMPWSLEWERHRYHFDSCRRFFPWRF